MTEKRIMQRTPYLSHILVEERSDGGSVSQIAVVDELADEEVMVFEPFEPQDAIAFADGYAYCLMINSRMNRRRIWRRILGLIRGLKP